MHRLAALCVIICLLAPPAFPRLDNAGCGTHRERSRETLFLHRQSVRTRAARRALSGGAGALASAAANRDIGHIAILEDGDGVVARQNEFNLEGYTLRFTPSDANATGYKYATLTSAFDTAATAAGTAIGGFGDDESSAISLPFAFPFFGTTYREAYVNSDGNLTFTTADHASTDRSLGRFTSGAPRISALFADLDPSKTGAAVRVLAEAARVVVTWSGVPEYSDYGTGSRQTFQMVLYAGGRIEFSYATIAAGSALVGIAPGGLRGKTSLVSFRNDTSGDYTAAVAERFGDELSVDVVTAAQKFYETHEDAYDYLVIFNNLGIAAGTGAVAYENTVRSTTTGIGDEAVDSGSEYGSASRLQAALNLGPLSQYPKDPNGTVPARSAAGDTPLTVIAHEAGHLFLAFASVRDSSDAEARPMLGSQQAHWSFLFNSEASLLEGERITDNGAAVSPRFLTTGTVEAYSPLDQYLMGFRAAADVAPMFLATGPSYLATFSPMRNFSFDGGRRDIAVEEVIAAEGTRIPAHTVAQRHFRFAFILVVARGTDPGADDLAKLEAYRAQFEPAFAKFADNRAMAGATLKKSLKLSLFPAAGVLAGSTASGSITLATAPQSGLTVDLTAPNGFARPPASVTVAAGATGAAFTLTGVQAGVEEITATPRDDGYETAFARVQVAAAGEVQLELVSGGNQVPAADGKLASPVVVRVTDANRLPYPGAKLAVQASAGGTVVPASPVTEANGQAAIQWTPGTGASNQLRIAVEAAPAASLTLNAGSGVAVVKAAVNRASGLSGLAPGSLATLTGANLAGGAAAEGTFPWASTLAGVRVTVNGTAVPLLAVSDTAIGFYIPADTPTGTAAIAVQPPSGAAATTSVTLATTAPGIFLDSTARYGAIVSAGTGTATSVSPVQAGDAVEIYCTGLGPTRTGGTAETTVYQPTVYMGGMAATVLYSGLTSVPGFYQVNAQVPAGLASGTQIVELRVNSVASNKVSIELR